MTSNHYTAMGSVLTLAIVSTLVADDWPQWRGPTRDGVWRETGLVQEFAEKQLKPVWKAQVSAGYSGPTVADGRVYVSDRIESPEQIERVHCFDARTGEPLWKHEYDCVYEIHYTAGPRSAIAIDAGRAYQLGAMGHLYCYDAASGSVLWNHDLNAEYNIRMPIWGISASPLVVDDLLIVMIGGGEGACLVAFDKSSGKEQWRALDEDASYSSPMIIEQAGQRVLLCWTGDSVSGLDPLSGKLHWRVPFSHRNMVINIPMPVLHKERLFLTSFYDGCFMMRIPKDRLAADKIWTRIGLSEKKTDGLHSTMSTPVFNLDYIYGVDSYGELRCLDAETGDRVWEDLTAVPKDRWSNIHFVTNKDRVWMFSERGDLIIGKLSPSGYQEISRAHLIDPTEIQLRSRGGVCWSHPAYAYRHIFARNDEELVCASLAADD